MCEEYNHQDLILTTSEIATANAMMKIYDAFKDTVSLLQSESEMVANFVLISHIKICNKLDKLADDVTFVLAPLAQKIKERYLIRVQMKPEFVAAAIMDPDLLNLPVIVRYLNDNHLAASTILNDMIEKYVHPRVDEPSQSSNSQSSSLNVMVNFTFNFP